MRVRFVVGLVSTDWAFGPGQEVELEDSWAEALVSAGTVVPVKPEAETASVAGALETAALPKSRARR